MAVECSYERCVLRGDDVSEIKVVLKEILADAIPPGLFFFILICFFLFF